MNHVHFENKKVSLEFFWLIWIIYTVTYMTKNCFSAAMASIVFEGVMTKSQTGLITAIFYIVYAPLQIVGGIAADKYDPERLIKIGLIGAGIANLIIFFNQNYYLVLTVWTLNAVVQFGIWPSVFKIMTAQLEPSERRPAVFYMSFSSAVGLMLAYLIAAVVPNWESNFLISSVSLFASAIILHIATKYAAPYTVKDKEIKPKTADGTEEGFEGIKTSKLFLESGLYILLIVVFLRVIILYFAKTLSATMLMESYDNVSPSIGNILNVIIIGVGIIGTALVKTVLYPNRIKSAPTGIVIMLIVSLISAVPLVFIGKINLIAATVSLCILAGSLTAGQLFTNYCSMRFEKFGKSGIVSGVTNAISSAAVVVNSYGVTKAAEVFSWKTVSELSLIALAVSLVLALIALPFWKNFKKKYHGNNFTR